jgi:hypothetical protein
MAGPRIMLTLPSTSHDPITGMHPDGMNGIGLIRFIGKIFDIAIRTGGTTKWATIMGRISITGTITGKAAAGIMAGMDHTD